MHLGHLGVADSQAPGSPAASTSSQAFCPGGFLKVEPPVRVLTGWVEERASVMAFISARIVCRIAGRPSKQRFGEDHVLRHAGMAIGEAHLRDW